MDYHLGVLSNAYSNKIKGFRKPFDSLQKESYIPTYQYKKVKNIDEIKMKLAEQKN
jgi:hypothetical protein